MPHAFAIRTGARAYINFLANVHAQNSCEHTIHVQVYREEDLLTAMYGVPLRFDPALIRQASGTAPY